MRRILAGSILLLISCSDSRTPRESASPITQPANEQIVVAPTATPYANTPYDFQGLEWGLSELAVRESLQARGFRYLGGLTADDKDTSPLSCRDSLRPKGVPDISFEPDSAEFEDCKRAPVQMGDFHGRVLGPTDQVNPWFDDSRALVRLKVRTKAFSLEDAEQDYTDIRATLVDKYGSAVQDSLTNDKDLLLVSEWWDSAGHSMSLALRESNYGRLAGPPEYEVSVDYVGPHWAAFSEKLRQQGLSTFK